MTRFLALGYGGKLINADLIKTIEQITPKIKGDRCNAIAVLKDGTRQELSWGYDETQISLMPSAPASPGFHLLAYYRTEKGGDYVLKSPVVAWKIDMSMARPICPDDFCEEEWAILYPDGRVVCPFNQWRENEAKWVEHHRQKAIENEEREAQMKKLTVV
jgi:hypothetical protein